MKSPLILVSALSAVLGVSAQATDITWSGTNDFTWSTATNWSPATAAPTTLDNAILANTGTNRTIIYNSTASGALGTLSFAQTSAFLNELSVQRNLTITNAVALGATVGGTAQITVAGTVGVQPTLTFTNGLTINAGGILALNFAANGATSYTPSVSGSITLNGGLLSVGAFPTTYTGSSIMAYVNNDFTLQSGTLVINNTNGTVAKDVRLQIAGNFTATGGAVVTASAGSSGMLILNGATNSFSNCSFASNLAVTLQRAGDQTLTGLPALTSGYLYLRGSGTKTISGSTVGPVAFTTAAGSNVFGALKLGSNLTLNSGNTALLTNSALATSTGTLTLGVDANGYTFDMSTSTASSGVWTPNNAGGNTLTNWALSSSATNGRIKSKAFNFNGASVNVSVGANLTIEANGGNSTANNLGSGTALDAASTFLYSGNATAALAATLTSSRDIGKLEVSSGALNVSGSFQALDGIAVDAGATTLIVSGTLAGNSTLGSGATLAGSGKINGTVSGTSANINGSGLTIGATTLHGTSTLSGTNTAASVNVADGTTTVSGTTSSSFNVSNGATLAGSGRANGTVAVTGGAINGSGLSLGDTTFHGNSTLSGTNTATSVNIADGTTTVSGTATSASTVTVNHGATVTNNGTVAGAVEVTGVLNGTGSINGSLTIKNTGELAPGNSPGTTTVNGNFTVENGAKVSLQIDKALATDSLAPGVGGNYDQIIANGLVILSNGSELDFTTLNNAKVGDVFNLILNDGTEAFSGTFSTVAISGTAQTLTNNSFTYNGLIYDLSYTGNADGGTVGNDLTLTVVPEPSTWMMMLGGIGMLAFGQRLRRRSV